MDGSDNNTIVNVCPHKSGPPASPQQLQILPPMPGAQATLQLIQACSNIQTKVESICQGHTPTQYEDEDHICMIDKRQIYSITYQEQQFAGLNSKMDRLLQKMGAAWTKNTALHEAYHASRQETALLRAAVATLMKTLNKNIAISTPP
jgi:hypothetical protein